MQKKLSTNEIRQAYLDFFKDKDHAVVPSSPLVPENDPTTLFTGSGMQPMITYLLGQKHPLGTRITDSQTCLRVNDIDEVGDNRHTTFFEMLGNWSLGDYFKQEQIPWMFSFLTEELDLDPSRIYVTVFKGNKTIGIPRDEESAKLWQAEFKKVNIDAAIVDNAEIDGMQGGRIFYYDEKKNWWSRSGVPKNMPVGEPGGPDTEMFWDFGAERNIHETSEFKDTPCHVNCDCGRFLEIGNNVFMQYIRKEEGFVPLPQQNVDFGGGLERLAAAVNDNPDVFTIDIFSPLKRIIETLSGKTYEENPSHTKSFRIIMDHVRAATFLIADGVTPSNKDQGYFSRRLIRRAVQFADNLGISEQSCAAIAQEVINMYAQAYPKLQSRKKEILGSIQEEEQRFRKTLSAGLSVFNQATKRLNAGEEIPSSVIFDLYQSYGFPLEMSQELAAVKNLTINEAEFRKSFAVHKDISRAGAEQKFKGGLADHSEMSVKYHTATHLLHQALRQVLGDHAMQKGSNITKDRLRFDFSHPEKMTPEQIKEVEDIVNEQIKKDMSVTKTEMTVEEAKQKGALGLFEHKYGDKVSVYTIGDFSCEICGGPHVEHTGTLGTFKITKEESAGAGVRRIKAILA